MSCSRVSLAFLAVLAFGCGDSGTAESQGTGTDRGTGPGSGSTGGSETSGGPGTSAGDDTTTVTPTTSGESSSEGPYVQRSFPFYAVIAAALLPFLYFSRPLVLALFGSAYESTIPVFQILFIGTLGTLVTHPFYLVLYTMNRPHLFSLIQGLALLGWLIAGCFLIPGCGALGAAWTTLIARMLQSLAIVVILGHALGFLGSTKHRAGDLAEGTRGV